ncbi:MAG: beta-galactosidase [Clostridia bacterium]|nr:beta-galactosidase [Clostridia bacterium]
MSKSIHLDHITTGVCYYPEHWDRSLWRDDLKRMKAVGLETVRIAEFAWNKIEPREGEFDFSFFDAFMDLALEEGMKVIFCTPTATPPAWMSHKYPEILNADVDGNLIHLGLRRHCNLNSEKYRFFTARIVEKIAAHYGQYPNIVCWQLDNEINCECALYYSESDHKAFRAWLRERFGTLDALNKAIGAAFWNQTYTDWEEVFLPRRTNYGGHGNPHMALLQKRFISHTVVGYFQLQANIIRKYSAAPITTNGLFGFIDYHALVGKVLDFITYDNYPNFHFDRKRDPKLNNGIMDRNNSYKLMRTRSISSLFGIMEQQSGPGGWNFRLGQQTSPKPGQLRLWSLQAVAHGADLVSYFRWRTCAFGNEIYWHGILDYDNRDNRRLREVAETHADLQRIQAVCGKPYMAEVALLRDYDNEWDGYEDNWHGEIDSFSADSWFKACQKKHVPLDMVYLSDDTDPAALAKYRLLVYPHATILNEKRAHVLQKYVQAGGTVIFGCRTGYKDENGICPMRPMPGPAAALCGATVEEFTFVRDSKAPPCITLDGKSVSVPHFHDVLEITDGEVIARFEEDHYSGKPALVQKSHGTGRVLYLGAAFGEDTASALLDHLCIGAPCGLGEVLELPERVELAVRGGYAFLLNYDPTPTEIPCRKPCKDILNGVTHTSALTLPPYGAAVLEL